MTHAQSAKSNGVCLATVTNTVKKYFESGIDAVTEFKRNVNSDNARRVLDGRAEARIIELALAAWEVERNTVAAKVNWQFRTADARVKLSSLYPKFTTASE